MEKPINFRKKKISVEDAREMINELSVALAEKALLTEDSPAQGSKIITAFDPRWVSRPGEDFPGSLLFFRDGGYGWRGFFLPLESAKILSQTLLSHLDRTAETDKTTEKDNFVEVGEAVYAIDPPGTKYAIDWSDKHPLPGTKLYIKVTPGE